MNTSLYTPSYNTNSTKPLYYLTRVVWYLAGIFEILLAFRFFLKLFEANPNAGFTSFIYSATYPLAWPFLTVFRTSSVDMGSVFEWGSLLAMIVYWLIALGLIKLLLMGRDVPSSEAAKKLEKQDR